MGAKDKNQATAADALVGTRIRLRRKMLCMSAERLAEELELSVQQVLKYESAKNRVGAGRLYDIAVILRVPISYFFEGLSPSVGDTTTAAPVAMAGGGPVDLLDAEGMKLARAFSRVRDPGMRKQIASLIAALTGEKKP